MFFLNISYHFPSQKKKKNPHSTPRAFLKPSSKSFKSTKPKIDCPNFHALFPLFYFIFFALVACGFLVLVARNMLALVSLGFEWG